MPGVRALSRVAGGAAIDVSAVVVNYNSSEYLEGLVETLFADRFEVDGRPGRLEVILVDNASREEDQRRLEGLLRDDVRLILNTENVGYGLANNQGFHVARGRWHLVTNPDVRVRPGCLGTLLDALESRGGAGIAGPLATMDVEGEVRMPPNELPDPYLEHLGGLARFETAVARFNARRRTRFAHRYWTGEEPFPLPMLSGCFLLGRRESFEEHGLFDPGYPLYYEDTDLFRRFHERGLPLWHVPRARIVHHFSRSTLTRMKAAMYRHRIGARRYFRMHFGEAGYRSWRRFQERVETRALDHVSPVPLEELAPAPDPVPLLVPDVPGAYLEVAGNPQFSLAVGIFPPEPGPYTFPPGFWEQLGPAHYWCRVVDPATSEPLKTWRMTKCLPS